MSKFTYTPLTSLTNETSAVARINANFSALQTAIEKTLSRDGTSPNTMTDDLDMNSKRIVNLRAPVNETEPLRLKDWIDADVGTFPPGSVVASLGYTPANIAGDTFLGATVIPFTQNGVNPAARTVDAKLKNLALTPEDFGCVGDGTTDDTVNFQRCLDAASSTGNKSIYLKAVYYVGNLTIPANNMLIVGMAGNPDPKVDSSSGIDANPYLMKGQLKQKTGTTITNAHGTKFLNVIFSREGLSLPCHSGAEVRTALAAFAGNAITSDMSSLDIERCLFFGHEYPLTFHNTGGAGLLTRCHFKYNIVDCLNGPYIADSGEPNIIEGNYHYPIMTVNVRETVTVNAATEVVNHTAHGFVNDQRVYFDNSGGALPSGITAGTKYYIVVVNANSYRISTTAGGGSLVAFADAGTGTHYVHVQEHFERSGQALFLTQRCTSSIIVHNLFFGFALGVQLGETDGTWDSADPWCSNVNFNDNHLEMPPTTSSPVGVGVACEYFSAHRNFIIGYTYPMYIDTNPTVGNDSAILSGNTIVQASNSPYAVYVRRGHLVAFGNYVQGNGVGVGFSLTDTDYTGGRLYGNKVYNTTSEYDISTAGKPLTYIDGWTQWISYTPTFAATVGTITTMGTRTGRYRKSRNSVELTVSGTITTNGTGATSITATLPVNSNSASWGAGRVEVTSGHMLQCATSAGGSLLTIMKYDNTYPGADGAIIQAQIGYDL